MSVCRSCGAPIVWATVRTSGRRIPLDAEPSSAGNVLLHSDGTCQVLIRGLQIAVAGATWHTSHLMSDCGPGSRDDPRLRPCKVRIYDTDAGHLTNRAVGRSTITQDEHDTSDGEEADG